MDIFEENLRGYAFRLKIRSGVFSAKGLDEGTKLLAESLKVRDKTLVADLGSGSGILGMLAAKLDPSGHIHLLDDHLRAVELAKENVELNSLNNVEFFLSDLFSAVPERTYDQILSNPPQSLGNEFLDELINECFRHLKLGGSLWLVVKSNLRSVFERFMKEKFQDVKIIAHNKGYVVLEGMKNG